MTFWIVLGCILALIYLVGRIRVGAAVSYSNDGLFLNIKAGPKRIQVLPAPKSKREKKPKKQKKPKTNAANKDGEQEKPKRKVMDTVSMALRFLPLVGEAAGRFKRKIRIDRLKLHIIWGAEDPASAARGYGAGNAAMGILWPIVEHNFKVKDHDLRVDVDFERKKPEFIADAQITISIGQCFAISFRLGIQALKIYLGIRRDKTNKTEIEKAVQA